MRWSSEVIFGILGSHYTITRRGRSVRMDDFALPVVCTQDTVCERGGFYLADPSSMPQDVCPGCLVVCAGGAPTKVPMQGTHDLVFVDDEGVTPTDVLNTLQADIMGLVRWSMHLSELANAGADVKRLVEVSIPIFDNRITVVDYDLRVLAYCEADRSTTPWKMHMHERYSRVPTEVTSPYVDKLKHNSLIREPFFFVDPVGNNYCVNLFGGDDYLGCCSLTDEKHPIEPYETELFQIFSAAVRETLGLQGTRSEEQISTMRTIFSQMVGRQQVSKAHVDEALDLVERGLRAPLAEYKWCCVVIGGANKGHEIPEGYARKTIEELLPHSFALPQGERIVVFALIRQSEHRTDAVCSKIAGFLRDMNLRAGVSRTFTDVFQTFTQFRQASVALEEALGSGGNVPWTLFGDLVLDYLLKRCTGEFEAKDLVAPELVRLASAGPGGIGLEYIKTLRTYLDEECNGNRSAKVAYMHRSTFAQRMERIQQFVDLSTPERRLYLRLCLHLPGVDWKALAEGGKG